MRTRRRLEGAALEILDYQFEVLLLCDGQPVLSDAKQKVNEFLRILD